MRATTRPDCPAGCLGVQASLAAEGDLPPGTDLGQLARYLMTVANGVAVQTARGATRDELRQVADMALRNWPPA
ncbi:hypothetical protein [Streptomyces sp. NEAU-H3]|uniref:hypothetical protein n=1 Tax=Streptomyces sp. NEAU-H3 TaxID=2720636 RepID=UPI0035B652A5